ncbi:hypothetical protein KY285_027313 [Solanum tuberosum]|nr:hypothetical protein KY285_027313 [Solanum tuberosum]
MVALVGGGHNIGFVHCKEFANRIFAKSDPTMNPKLVDRLRGICATNPEWQRVLGSVQLILSDPRTRPFVEKYAKDADFARAMEKLNVYKVKVDNQGEVRRRCDAPNTFVGNKPRLGFPIS